MILFNILYILTVIYITKPYNFQMKTKALIRIVQSLSKSEKRHFHIESTKTGSAKKKYMLLYSWIERYNSIDEDELLAKHPSIKKSQLPNLKNNLYTQILRSLRETHKDLYPEIQAREHFDFAKVLYAKGEYVAALSYLKKARVLASEIQKSSLVYLAMDFEKQIESQHITGSIASRAKDLTKSSSQLLDQLSITNALSNLSLLMYGRYLKRGFVKNETDYKKLQNFYHQQLPDNLDFELLDYQQKLYYYQSRVWYYYMGQRFSLNYRYCKKWVQLFDLYPEMRHHETAGYLKALHNLLSSLFVANKKQLFEKYYVQLLDLQSKENIHFHVNEASLFKLFQKIHGINRIFLFADYENGKPLIREVEQVLLSEKHKWDGSRIIVFQYKIACVHFGNDNYEQAIFWLNQIINENYGDVKQDIQCYARILSLITHYEMGNDVLVSNQIINVYRFLLKMKDLGQVQREIFIFLRKSSKVNRNELNPEFRDLRMKLKSIRSDVFERRAYLYLDLISWLDSKLKGIRMIEAIRQNENL